MHKKNTLFVFSFVLITLVGCGPRLETVQGTVTLDGTPLEDVTVSFLAVDGNHAGKIAYARTDAAGDFVLNMLAAEKYRTGAFAGQYKVAFRKDVYARKPTPREQAALDDGLQVDIEMVSAVPQKYMGFETSDFVVDVSRGRNRFDFELKSKP